ncbi:ribose-phosphate diphosphokinase [Candidatus Woesearchaeota archaeon]|nr:ribose-phosphate diphosphokinase [Candidatus Woesearchaeota archaeon]
MLRGEFHIFACRGGEAYAQKLVFHLRDLVKERGKELLRKDSLTLQERRELEFYENLREQDIGLGKATVVHFLDDEMNVQLDKYENVRDKDVFLVQCPYNTTDDLTISQHLLETFLFLDSLRRAKARSVTLISLYFPYGRGDKQHAKDGVPASLLANLVTMAGMDNVVTMDLHADQILGFFDPTKVRVEHLHASPLMIHFLQGRISEGAKMGAPDTGAAKRTQFYARHLEKPMLMAYKRRSYERKHTVDETRILGLPGKEEVVVVDDLVSSGRSVAKVIERLAEKGTKRVVAVCSHPLLTGDAVELFDKLYEDKKNPFQLLVGTDAIPHHKEVLGKPWYVELDTSRFIAKAVFEMHTSGSLTKLHDPFCVQRLGLWVPPKNLC